MQIQHPPKDKEFNPIADLITRFQIAYRVFTSRNAIIIADNELDIFNFNRQEVVEICCQIVGDLTLDIIDDEETEAVHQLVYGN